MTPNQNIVSAKFRLCTIASATVYIKQTLLPYSVDNVSSEVVGIPIVNGFTQTDYTVNIFGNNVIVNIYGTSSIHVFIEGIGTIYSDSTHYQIKINKLTGLIYATIMFP